MIHEPARLLIITMLYPVASMDFLRLRKVLGYTAGNLSSHLAKLEAVGYVAMEKKFKGKYPMTICSLTKKGPYSDCRLCGKFKEYVESDQSADGEEALRYCPL